MMKRIAVALVASAAVLLGVAEARAVTVYLTTRDTTDITLAGVTFARGDIVAYNTETVSASLFFNGRQYFRDWHGDTGGVENIDALYVYSDGRMLLSTDSTARLGQTPLKFDPGDVVLFDMVTDTASIFLPGDGGDSVFRKRNWSQGASEDVDAFHLMANGHYLLSTNGDARLGDNHLRIKPGDIVEYDPVNDEASVYFDSTLFRKANGDPQRADAVNVDGVSELDDSLLLSVANTTARLGAPPDMLTFRDGDIVLYDLATDQASLFFSEDMLHCFARDIDGLSVLYTSEQPPDQPQPVPEPVTMVGLTLGICGLGGYLRRRRV